MFRKIKHFIYQRIVKARCKKMGIRFVPPVQVSKSFWINGNPKITLGRGSRIGAHVMFGGNGVIEIGDNVSIGDYTFIYSSPAGGVYIGNDSILAPFCFVIDSDHDISLGAKVKDTLGRIQKISIGSGVWIGTHCCILLGSTLGDGCCVGAGTVIKGSFDGNSVIIGAKASCIKQRS